MAAARGSKVRVIGGVPLVNVYWERSPHYSTIDGRYQIHGVRFGSGQGSYWVIDAETGERVNDYYYPAYEWDARDSDTGQVVKQRVEARYGPLANVGFRDVVRMLRDYIAAKEAAA